jgi:DNA repair exonuclease SbcCD nuclease subunit
MTDFKSHFKKPNSHAIAVLISDIHYNLTTLPLADAAMRQAIAKANSLQVPLIVAGDLHDSKANMRAECVNAMIETFGKFARGVQVIIMRGNHDQINEKSVDHTLNFLKPYQLVLDNNQYIKDIGYLIPYYHDVDELRLYLKTIPPKSTLIMHQGIISSNSGDYIQDKSAITKDDVAGFRVISGHYHQRQTIDLPGGGKWDYIGNPYTLNYGEANDPPKGFQILMDDGSLEFVPTNLRKHVILNVDILNNGYWQVTGKVPVEDVLNRDLVWVKVKGTKERLASVDKTKVANMLDLTNEFRLDLIPTDTETKAPDNKQSMTQGELLDSLIDSLTNTGDDVKSRLKSKWKDLK